MHMNKTVYFLHNASYQWKNMYDFGKLMAQT